MNAIGVVCEFNPFHKGHLALLERSRALLGPDTPVVCVMSGDFVQRGEAAVYSKFARAEAACLCGADLVVELPLPWSLASAEGFARGAVSLLDRLGVTHLCFGSESGETETLSQIARCLMDEALTEEIKALLAQEPALSFAAARQRAVRARLGDKSRLLSAPNDILAVEYLKAVSALGLDMVPLAVRRLGAGHDSADEQAGLRSASSLRELLRRGEPVDAYVPAPAAAVFARERESGRMQRPERLEPAMLSRLRLLDEEDFLSLPDAADGLGRRIYRAVREQGELEAVYAAAKTKRYALSRVRRVCLCACLGIRASWSRELPPYARVLAANSRGRALLRRAVKAEGVPLVTRPAAVRSLPPDCAAVFSLGAAAQDLFVLGYDGPSQRACGRDWRTGPFLPEERQADPQNLEKSRN